MLSFSKTLLGRKNNKKSEIRRSNLQYVFQSACTYDRSPMHQSMSKQPKKTPAKLAIPVAEVIRTTKDPFSLEWFNELTPLIAKLLEWSFFFLLGYFNLGYSWLVLLATLNYVRQLKSQDSVSQTITSKLSAITSEQEVLAQHLSQFPSWVHFPDFEKVEWINDILRQLWPSIDGYATTFVKDFIEPEIRRILDRMRLEGLSGLQIKKVAVGTIPLRLGGIKVYNRNVSKSEIVLDSEVVYNGDARVIFSLQGVQAEINQIRFKAMARVTLKPVLGTFPFLGGFDFYFLNKPLLEYGLGGVGSLAEVPGASSIIRTVVEDQIRSRFIWPNKFHLYLPIDIVQDMQDKTFLLPKPSGVLKIVLVEARNLLKKDKYITGSGQSDPYANLTLGQQSISFRDKYVAKTVNPKWNYCAEFVVEDLHGLKLKVDVFDYDHSSSDDFLGRRSLELDHLVVDKSCDEWITLDEVKHGEIHINSMWREALPLENNEDETWHSFVLSLYIHHCSAVDKKSGSPPYTRCILHHGQNEVRSTRVQNKNRDPDFNEGFMFHSRNVEIDEIMIEVQDSKNEIILGWVKVPMKFVCQSPNAQFSDMQWQLNESESGGTINLSAKMFGIKEN